MRKNDPIISLDFHQQELLGPGDFIQQCTHWTNDIIALKLDHIGHQDGTDFEFYRQLLLDLPDASAIHMGGGVRNIDDLKQAKTLGLSGALIATALHYKTISQHDLVGLVTNSF